MQVTRYLFGILFFFVFLTVLIIIIVPIGPGNSKITSYFSTPGGNIHYSQVPEGINATAYIIINNDRRGSYDLTNYSFKTSVWADIPFSIDIEIISLVWIQNFTILENNITTITLTFKASIKEEYPNKTLEEFYIQVDWGSGAILTENHRMAGLKIGSTYEIQPFFTFHRIMILLMAIGMGLVLFILVFKAKRDIQHYRRRHRPRRVLTTPPISSYPRQPAPTMPIPAITDIPIPPPQTSAKLFPTETMKLIPCPKCGSKIDNTQIICPNCGYELSKCAICNLIIDKDDPIEICPECGATGHRAHFREWVHVKGYCPICKKALSF